MTEHGVFVYVSCADSQDIHVHRMDMESGALQLVQTMPVPGKVMPMAVTPDRRFLFAALRTPPYAVVAFAVDQRSGHLTALNSAPLPLSALYLSVDATGRHLFATTIPESKDRRHSMISVTPIGPNGHVHPPRQSFRAEPKIHCVLPDPGNRFVYAASCIGEVLIGYGFDAATGRLSEDGHLRARTIPGAGPRHIAFHPDGRFLYLLNETDGTIYVFAFDASTGTLVERQIIETILPQNRVDRPMGADLHLTPDGRFLYASERGGHTLGAFRVGAEGELVAIGHYPTERQPRGFRIDPFGRFAVVAGQHSHAISVHAINADDGTLERRHQYPSGQAPNWVEILRLW
jgi:6-phosphogluconolactonase